MESPPTALKRRIHHIRHVPPGVIEIHTMLHGHADHVVWRRTRSEVEKYRSETHQYPATEGHIVIHHGNRILVHGHDRRVTHPAREGELILSEGPEPDWQHMDRSASLAIKRPYRLAESLPRRGAPINIEANHATAILRLTVLPGSTPSVLGVACQVTGARALYLDPSSSPHEVQDWFLDHMKALSEGRVLDWTLYDREWLAAVQSYRRDDFVRWLSECTSGKVGPDEIASRLDAMPPGERRRVLMRAGCFLLPHLVHFIRDEKGVPEELKPESPLVAPNGLFGLLGETREPQP